MDIEKCNCGAIEMEVAENEYRDGDIHHRGTHRCIPLTDVADWRDLATLKSERDSLERIVRVLGEGATKNPDNYGLDFRGWNVTAYDFDPMEDFDLLRSLITPEGETE
jgi:hypothetical protein